MRFARLILLCLLITLPLPASLKEKPFVVVIPSYNNKNWVQQNLNSVFSQKYQNYRIIYISDASTDGTDDLVETFAKQNHQEHRFTLIKNKEKSGPLACICQAVFSCDPQEIIVDLDGNDWLANDEVLQHLNKVYSNPAVWMTYGQFMYHPQFIPGFASKVPFDVIQQNAFRSFKGAVTHLKTFYAGLFQKIEKEDLLWENKFIPKAADLAYTIPMLEMAGVHSRFIPEVLYIYNCSESINEHKSSNDLEEKMDRLIRSKKKYSPLSELSFTNLDPIYNQVSNIFHPTIQDYQLIQNFLSNGKRQNLERLRDMMNGARQIKIIGKHDEFPQSGSAFVNCDHNEKENCVILYSSFNRNYPGSLHRLFKYISQSDFKGHVLYRIGGWPNTEGGSLPLAHVPYAFKVSYFKEAQRLGYKRILWLDSAVLPLVSLNDIFEMIKEKGFFLMGCDRMLGPYMNSQAAAFFGFTLEQTFKIPSGSAGLCGVDLENATGRKILDWWYRAAHDPDAFFSARSDQNALSMIFYRLNLSDDIISMDRMPHSTYEIKPDSLFLLDSEFAHGL